ncbi:MAG TPA: cytochrome ubiquinol oxidase subunit I [Thermodesulfobacteriota bacterium]
MSELFAARTQMALSLGFHIVFAAVGMALPIMMLAAEGRWLRTGDGDALRLAKTWARVTAVLFAVGAVSGTALSFELGLLWPTFMEFAGPLFGLAFTMEGFAFFIEAIFLGLYLYGWNRLSPRAHWLCGIPVAVSGAASGILVLSANSWMQTPAGFDLTPEGRVVNVDPIAAFFNPAYGLMALHSTLSVYQAVGFAAAGVYAYALLRGRRPERAAYNRRALAIAMALGGVTAILQPIAGDRLAKQTTRHQPAKLAAMEAQFETERGAPLRIGGWPDEEGQRIDYAIEIPGLLSYLATGDFDGEVKGLADFPRDEWPPVRVVHVAFQVMVGCGVLMAALAVWFGVAWWRDRRAGRDPTARRGLLRALVLAAPLGFVAIEAGWTVTEVGRQPWIAYGVMRTAEGVTPATGVPVTLALFTLLYLGLTVTLIVLLRRLSRGEGDRARAADGPASAHAGGSHAGV